MQEDIENKSVHLAISTTKLTARMVVKGLALWYRHHKTKKAEKIAEKPTGKQSVKELIGQDQGVSSMPMSLSSKLCKSFYSILFFSVAL